MAAIPLFQTATLGNVLQEKVSEFQEATPGSVLEQTSNNFNVWMYVRMLLNAKSFLYVNIECMISKHIL